MLVIFHCKTNVVKTNKPSRKNTLGLQTLLNWLKQQTHVQHTLSHTHAHTNIRRHMKLSLDNDSTPAHTQTETHTSTHVLTHTHIRLWLRLLCWRIFCCHIYIFSTFSSQLHLLLQCLSQPPFYPLGPAHAIGNLFILRPFHICLGPYSMCSVPLPRLMFQVCSVYLLLLLLLLVLSLSLLLLRLFAWPGQWGVSKLFVCQGPSQDIKAAICARHTNDLENCAVFLSVSSNTHT